MSHDAPMSSNDPGCIIFMIDQSGSMGHEWRGTDQTIAYGAAKAVNSVLAELVARCKKGEDISPRVRVGLFGYSEPNQIKKVDWASDNTTPESDGLLSIPEVYKVTEEVYDPEEETYVPWVVTEEASGGTPMQHALQEVLSVAENFAQTHSDSFPPIIINITDGEPTDMDHDDIPNEVHPLTSVATADGNALMCNVHLSKVQAPQAFLPSSENGLPDEFSKSLFRASSEVPDGMANVGRTKDALDIPEGARLFAYNADPTALLQLLTLASSAPVGKE